MNQKKKCALAPLYPWLFGSCVAISVQQTCVVTNGGVYTVSRPNSRITLTLHPFSVMLNEPHGWGFTTQDKMIVFSVASWQRTHGQRVLLINSVQLFCAHGMSDEIKLLREGLAAVCHTDIRNVSAPDVVTLRTFLGITGTQPVAFGLEL